MKTETYRLVYEQVKSLTTDETDDIAAMANTAALLHEAFGFWWTGFYRVIGNELVLGPFQGPLACTRIGYGKGVCGTAWKEARSIVVDDVEKFDGHIACSSASKSEIVVPIIKNGVVKAVIDIDSQYLSHFDDEDRTWLEKIASLL